MKSDRYYLLMKPSQNTWSGILVMDSSSAQPVCLFDDASINGKNNVCMLSVFQAVRAKYGRKPIFTDGACWHNTSL
jgi:hypothetical protein